jgi:hypothetical protein
MRQKHRQFRYNSQHLGVSRVSLVAIAYTYLSVPISIIFFRDDAFQLGLRYHTLLSRAKIVRRNDDFAIRMLILSMMSTPTTLPVIGSLADLEHQALAIMD